MKIQQFIKSLNNTELGKGNAHETYVSVPKKTDIGLIFDPEKTTNDMNLDILDLITVNKLDKIRYGFKKANKEYRITGLGSYYRKNDVNAGDEIIFERRDEGGKTTFFINLNHKSNSISFQKSTKGFEALNMDRLLPMLTDGIYESDVLFQENKSTLTIEFKEKAYKRSDSPELTDFYDLKINNKSILTQYKKDDRIQLEINSNISTLKKTIPWQHYKFNI